MDSIQSFCRISTNGSFKIWDERRKVFPECFSWIFLSAPMHSLFLVICSYLFGTSTFVVSIKSLLRKRWLIILLSISVVLSKCIELVLSYILNQERTIAYAITNSIILASWILYVTLQFKISRNIGVEKRKKKLLVTILFLLVILQAIRAYSLIKIIVTVQKYHNLASWQAKDFGLLIYTLLCLCCFIIFLVSKGTYNSLEYNVLQSSGTIQSEDSFSAKQDDDVYDGEYHKLENKDNANKIHLGVAEQTSNFLSSLTFWWVNNLVVKGYRKQLETPEDLFILQNDLSTRHLREELSNVLKKERLWTDNKEVKGKKFFRIMTQVYGKRFFLFLGFLQLLMLLLGFSGPIFLNLLVQFMENKNEPSEHGYYYAAGLFFLNALNILVVCQYTYNIEKTRTKMRAGLITAIFEKTMNLNTATLTNEFTTGEVVNFMSTDVNRVIDFCYNFHDFWGLFVEFGICLYLLYLQLGIAFLASLGVAILSIPVMVLSTKYLKKYSEKLMENKDKRVKLITEVLHGIRIIKFYAWEKHFEEEISKSRAVELKSLKGFNYVRAVAMSIWNSTPLMIAIAAFSTYVALGNELTAAKVFTSISLFTILNRPFNQASWNLSGLMDAWVSLKRIEKFLSIPEVVLDDYFSYKDLEDDEILNVDDASFKWKNSKKGAKEEISRNNNNRDKKGIGKSSSIKIEEDDSASVPFNLSNLCFVLKKGTFLGITGKVGSGKSSLFAALITDMDKESGNIYIDRKFEGYGFISQESWIQNMTVRENILFGKEYDEEKYNSVIYACALKDDIEVLPAGDQTEIGENGINLSGGQKARISLARAVYQEKEIYLLDDPLAAVDSHVASHLFKHCVMGILKDKTRLLSTHHLKFLQAADNVLILNDGVITAYGAPNEVLTQDVQTMQRQISQTKESSDKMNDEDNDEEEKDTGKMNDNGKLVDEEEKAEGAVGFHIYKYYLQAVGNIVLSISLSCIFLTSVSEFVGSWWLAYWTGKIEPTSNPTHDNKTHFIKHWNNWQYFTLGYTHSLHLNGINLHFHYNGTKTIDEGVEKKNLNFYLPIYAGIIGAGCFAQVGRSFSQAYGSIQASIKLHQNMLAAILQAPVVFFDTTPIGRITNRFSSDIYQVDATVAIFAQATLLFFFGIIGVFVMTCYSLPWFTIPMLPIACIYYFTQQYYRHSSRELKRLASVSLSPIYQHFTESLNGLMTIRAFREGDRFIKENEYKLDLNQRANYAATIVEIWLFLRLGILGVTMIGAVGLLAVLEHHFQTVQPGLVGLAISLALSMQSRFQRFIMIFTQTEKSMVNTERVLHYIKETPAEDPGTVEVGTLWPYQGTIELRNVSMRYRDELPLVVNNISFEVNGGEKIGICGRTGSGKSSLFRMLFKIVDLSTGCIVIDGIDIKTAKTEQVRSRLSIIPQDPFLFDDTVSKNLDPRNEYTDEIKYDALKKCHLYDAIQQMGGLSAKVGERGGNLSTGQKQLICLARALLKRSKIICIDEATASVDHKTDKWIQETIRSEFSTSTVLTIAHRMETIMDSDRVLVMENGKVAEFDEPNNLLQIPDSLFTALVARHTSMKS